MQHRGRFQAQGDKLEESTTWAQDTALLLEDGQDLLNQLEKSICVREAQIRAKGFAKCRKTMDESAKNGGIKVTDMGKAFIKSFPKGHKERLDLEVRLGTAFVYKKDNGKTP